MGDERPQGDELMRWVRYRHSDRIKYGIVNEDRSISEVDGEPFHPSMKIGPKRSFAEVTLLPPVMPGTFYAVGFNYLGHTAEAADFLKSDVKVPKKPDVGYRAASALIAHEEPIVIPANSSGIIQFEGELVAVIGRKAKHVSEAQALDCLLGYTVGNDVSERSWQSADRTIWRAKNSDTFKPMGPWIETDVDLDRLVTTIRLNGEQVSRFPTNRMIFGVARYISEISSAITLHPGDVLWMGSEAPTLDMRHGDVVEIEIDGIGTLRNPVIAENGLRAP
jgi:2-keto-4-pentenoate hydratase/2-oxohepta-3-ene-1,7-dioic acid hydratase in catechol pathway